MEDKSILGNTKMVILIWFVLLPGLSYALVTNRNEVNTLFEDNIENKEEFFANIEKLKQDSIDRINSKSNLLDISDIDKVDEFSHDINSIDAYDLSKEGNKARFSTEYKFYDENNLAPNLSTPHNKIHKHDAEDITSSISKKMESLNQHLQELGLDLGCSNQTKSTKQYTVCKGIPCLDGNCVDKSYQMDEDLLDSVSQLHSMSAGQIKDGGVSLFAGSGMHCSNKMLDSSICCNISPTGWLRSFGVKCKYSERLLAKKRADNLCVFSLENRERTLGIVTVRKKHYCCFNNIIEKIFQEQARAQLGMSFVKNGKSDCRGLTLEELSRVDFSKIDFSKVSTDIVKKIQLPDIEDIKRRVKSSVDNVYQFDESSPQSKDNKLSGINSKSYKNQSDDYE